MTMQQAVDVAQIFGAIGTALSVAIAVILYVNDYLRKQAEALWSILFTCESSFRRVYRDFDQRGLAEIVGKVLSHPKLDALTRGLFAIRNESEDRIKEYISKHDDDISYAIVDSLASASTSKLAQCVDEYEESLYRIKARYPVLHEYLSVPLKIAKYCTGISQKPETYDKLINETLLTMKKKGDLEKRESVENLQSFLYSVVIGNLSQVGNRQRLNDLLKWLSELTEHLMELYRSRGPLALWWLSRSERHTALSRYKVTGASQTLKAIVSLKQRALGKQFIEAASLAGRAEAILKMEDDS